MFLSKSHFNGFQLEQMSAALAEMRQQMSSQEGVLQNMSNRLQVGLKIIVLCLE